MIAEKPVSQGIDAKSFGTMADAWTATLKSYEAVFGTKPPMDIWGKGPAPESPFTQAMQNMRKLFGLA